LDKRLFTALGLCFVIVLGWTFLSHQMGWTPAATPTNAPVTAANDATTPAGTAGTDAAKGAAKPEDATPAKPAVSSVVADTEERREVVQVGHFRAVFSNKGGVLEELRTSEYFDRAGLTDEEKADWKHWEPLVTPVTDPSSMRAFSLRTKPSSQELVRAPLESELWTVTRLGEGTAARGVEFRLAPGQGVTFVKRFVLEPESHQVRFELEVKNEALGGSFAMRNFVLTPASGMPNRSGDTFYSEPQAIAFSRARDGSSSSPITANVHADGYHTDALPAASPIGFTGVFNKYFAVLLRGADETSTATLASSSWRSVRDPSWLVDHPDQTDKAWRQIETDVELQLPIPGVGESRTWAYQLYAGPKKKGVIDAVHADHAVIVEHDLGFVSGISKLLLWVLGLFHSITSSWGIAIILLTIGVRGILFPINRRSQTAMARYQAKIKRIQPKIDELKKRYENDPSRLRQEQAKLMQAEDALMPPLGGCLPPLLQIPIFIGLYRALGVSFDLRQTPFMGWIHDLSLPDRLIHVDWTLPLFGHVPYINVLPPLMVVMAILQQRAMPKPTDEQALMMYKMMMFMPIVMGIFLYNYAAGLSLYMITQSTLGLIEQKIIKKYWPVDDKEPPQSKKKKGGFMQRLMEAQEQKVKELEARKKAASRR